MGYQALLFCPDEKLARVVTQVLSDLDFSVETATEPFAAVKKLMAQHFDAVVVDCDNEQNATLLFKSARNSSSNQSSLAVAVVEGQAGVAKAFRIGANLVLTKPINVEQAKGTLRVARGLLRKGADAKSPSAPKTSPEAPISQQRPAMNAGAPAQIIPPTPKRAPAVFPELKAPVTPVSAKAAPLEVESDPVPAPDPADAALLESLHEPTPQSGSTTMRKEFAWQQPKTQSGPMASALQRAAEASGKAERTQPIVTDKSASPVSSGGAAAAPAMAKESLESATEHAASQDLVPGVKNLRVVSTFPEPANIPSFGASAFEDEDETSKSKKPYFIVAAIAIAAGMAFYGWNLKHGSSAAPAQSIAPVSTAPVQATPEPVAPAPSSPVQNSQPVASQPTPTAHDQTAHAAKPQESSKTTLVAEDTVTKIAPLVVRAGASKLERPGAANEPAPQAPALNISGGSSDDAALNSVVASTPVNVPKHLQQTLRISQGVSQGLLLKRVQPVYPAQAMQMRIQGAVQLMATISKEGNISGLNVLSGDGILARSASDAVRQWKYKPYYLNGEPVEIQTQITVNFKLPN